MIDASPARSLRAILGPTNTGKTFFAIDRMLAHRTGMIGLPLRLLAREVYTRVVERVGVQAAALVTGEERIVPSSARYWICTVEAMPTDLPVEFLAIDEVQVATDFERGHVFTNRILHARGTHETLLLGAATMVPVIRALLPNAEIIHRPRLSDLHYAGSRKISRQPERTAIVAFSAAQVYAIAELIRRERGGAAVVMGALSPRTRNAQVELYQSRDVDFLVATDAIGMGLNLDVHHVAFADDTKFDGHQTRPLTPAEFGQIAGRAGRHMRHGTFGVTGRADAFDEDLVQRLESHDFEPVRVLQWRNHVLDFTSLDALRDSLDRTPGHAALTRVPVATDQSTLEFVARSEAARLATGEAALRLLWECCQIPDYRDISPAQHGDLVTRIYSDLRRHGHLDTDWIAEQVRFCDNIAGDIDTLSQRIKQVRTWTFVANRNNWLEHPAYWRENTREIEDRLSDALHERLTQRFVDRRTGVLIRHLRDRLMVSPEINERGEVSLEGHLIGTIEGFRFTFASSQDGDAKGLRAAADQVVAPQIRHRADRLAGAPNEELVLATDGYVRWRGEIVATLIEGDSLYAPRATILADESLTGPDLERVQDRLNLWLRHLINTQLETVLSLEAPADLDGPARGIAYRLFENLGLLPRQAIADEVKALDQDVRGKLRKLGVKFGAHHIYVPASLKPAPRELALILFALKNGGVRQAGVTEVPQIVLSGRTSFEIDPEVSRRLYEVAGFKVAGRRAVRVDILERLADIIRPLVALDARNHSGELPAGAAEANGFRVTVEMTSLLGCSGEDFASILTSLGYRVRRTPKVTPQPTSLPEQPTADGSTASQAAPDAAAEGAEPNEAPALAADDIDAAAASAVEGAPARREEDGAQSAAPEGEQTAIASASADLGASLPEVPTEEKADPEFDEVWFPAGRRPEGRRPHQQQNREARTGSAGAEGERAPRKPHGKPAGRFQGKPPHRERSAPNANGAPPEGREETPRPPRREQRPDNRQRPPRKEPAVDPDSPWAALAALRGPKS